MQMENKTTFFDLFHLIESKSRIMNCEVYGIATSLPTTNKQIGQIKLEQNKTKPTHITTFEMEQQIIKFRPWPCICIIFNDRKLMKLWCMGPVSLLSLFRLFCFVFFFCFFAPLFFQCLILHVASFEIRSSSNAIRFVVFIVSSSYWHCV